jgi:pyridoxine 4-dehydrogenase
MTWGPGKERVSRLLSRSPQILPIPGSGSPEHVEQNILAASIDLEPGEINAISEVATPRA